jgi:hypothetical protein
MTLAIDIFRIDGDGPRWIQAAASLEEARAHINKLAGASPGDYLVMNQITGSKVVIKVNSETDASTVAPSAIAPTDILGAARTKGARPAES